MGSSAGRKKAKQPGAPIPALPIEPPRGNFGKDLANWLFPIYLAVILLGFRQIRAATPGASNAGRALFTAINAATLTGFANGFPIDKNLDDGGQFAVLALIVCGSLFSMIVCSLAIVRVLRLRYTDLQIILAALLAEAAALIIGTACFFHGDTNFMHAAIEAASAFGNCGVVAGTLPELDQISTHLIFFPLAILGGLGLPVLMELVDFLARKKPLSRQSRTAISMTAWIFVIGFVLLLTLEVVSRHRLAVDGILRSSTTILESRTSGMPVVPARSFSHIVQWIIIATMAIGASSGGTGGGLKTTTIAELIWGVRSAIRAEPIARATGFALAWLASYGGIVLGAAMLLSYVMPEMSSDGVFFTAVSGASNVGLSQVEIPDRSNVYYALSAIMLMGRMAPAMILWWMAENNVTNDLAIG